MSANRPTGIYVKLAQISNIAICFFFPTVISWYFIWNPVSHNLIHSLLLSTSHRFQKAISALTLFGATILMLKLISYALVNGDLRREAGLSVPPARVKEPTSNEASLRPGDNFNIHEISYPDNITPKNLLYFIFCPTLVCIQFYVAKNPLDNDSKETLRLLLNLKNSAINRYIHAPIVFAKPFLPNDCLNSPLEWRRFICSAGSMLVRFSSSAAVLASADISHFSSHVEE